jgi:hypothetical protein
MQHRRCVQEVYMKDINALPEADAPRATCRACPAHVDIKNNGYVV